MDIACISYSFAQFLSVDVETTMSFSFCSPYDINQDTKILFVLENNKKNS